MIRVIRMSSPAWLLFAATAVAQAQTGVAIDGKVINIVTSQGIKRAYVVVRGLPDRTSAAAPETYICQTGADGRFSVAGVAPGRYEVEASHSGFQAKPPNRATTATYFPQLTIEPGKQVTNLELRLTPLGMIGGKILDDAGNAVPNADVEVMQYRYAGGKKTLGRVQRMQSDDHGEYFLSDLPPGRYYLRASNLEHDPPISGGVQNRGPAKTRIYAAAYYGGARQASGAAALEVAPGAELERVNIQLHRTFIYAIRGLAPAGSSQQIVRPAGEPGFAYATRMYGEPVENFEMDGIPPGLYPLRVNKPQQPGVFSFRRVDVSDRDIDGLDMRSSTGREVTGVVQLTGGAVVPMNSLRVILQPEVPGSGTDADGPVNADGSFKLMGQPDAYYVRVQAPAGTYLKSVRLGDRELVDHRLNPGSNSGKLTLVIANDTGKVEGSVEDANGRAAGLVRVTLIPDQRLPFWADLLQIGQADGNGKFAFDKVPPGDYKAFAWTDVENGASEDPDFRRPFEGQGMVVSVAPSGSATVKLRAIDTGSKAP